MIQSAYSYKLNTIKTREEIGRIENVWQKFEPSPVSDKNYYLNVLLSQKEIYSPYIIVVHKDDSPAVMVLGYIENRRLENKGRNNRIFGLNVKTLKIINKGILGDLSVNNCYLLVSELNKLLKRGEAEMVYFCELPANSPLYQIAKKETLFLLRDHIPNEVCHFKMAVPRSMDEFYAARKKKKHLFRIMRKLEEAFPGKHSFRRFASVDEAKIFHEDAYEVSKKTYQHALGGGIDNSRATLNKFICLAEKGAFLAYVLYINDKPCAFENGYVYKDTFFSECCGYDTEHKKYEVGTILMLKIIEDLCNSKGIAHYDFGPGDHWYKRRFCDEEWKEVVFRIFRPSFRGVLLNFLRLTNATINYLISLFDKSFKFR